MLVTMKLNSSSTLGSIHAKLMLIGSILLTIGLFSPWYYLSQSVDGSYYSLSAFGGSLADRQDVGLFSPLAGFVSLCFAVVCAVLPFMYGRLSEKVKKRYAAVTASLAGICGLLSVLHFHSWLDLAFPDDSFFYHDLDVSRGLGFGYPLVWVSIVFLFLAAYVSKGLVFETKK
jgi:hypothetical protein